MPDGAGAHGADLYSEDYRVLPTCQCGWEGPWVSTYDEAADAYAAHRTEVILSSPALSSTDDATPSASVGPVSSSPSGRR